MAAEGTARTRSAHGAAITAAAASLLLPTPCLLPPHRQACQERRRRGTEARPQRCGDAAAAATRRPRLPPRCCCLCSCCETWPPRSPSAPPCLCSGPCRPAPGAPPPPLLLLLPLARALARAPAAPPAQSGGGGGAELGSRGGHWPRGGCPLPRPPCHPGPTAALGTAGQSGAPRAAQFRARVRRTSTHRWAGVSTGGSQLQADSGRWTLPGLENAALSVRVMVAAKETDGQHLESAMLDVGLETMDAGAAAAAVAVASGVPLLPRLESVQQEPPSHRGSAPSCH